MTEYCNNQTYHICSLLILTVISFAVIITLCYLVLRGDYIPIHAVKGNITR